MSTTEANENNDRSPLLGLGSSEGLGRAPRTVADLQRELLAVCRGGRYAETWRKLNAPTEWPSLRGEFSKLHRANELREEIKALDPNAALYYGWAGPGDERPQAA